MWNDPRARRGENDAFFRGRAKLLRPRAAEDLIFKNKPAPARHRLKNNLAVPKLPAPASLFFMPALYLGTRRDRFFVGHFRWMEHYFHAVALLQFVDNGFNVKLTRAGK